ncbi:MAG: FABP family protein [Actinomycetaceae bacterium]|nr:FABP family protein [Arcanobacterium sp.]MDD7504909.1 FABP family protein [Actinomycetaceae bacterium]MDY6143255.1 FABP family protein [Arcanobacterium sp.]
MVMRLPSNLAPENYPLAWLIDSWQGGGILQYENVQPAAYVHELRIDASDHGPYLHIDSRVWLAEEPAHAVNKEASGLDTYNSLTKGELWAQSSGFLRVDPEAVVREDGAAQLDATISSPVGTAQVWVGLIKGPQLQLVTDAIARSGSGAQLDAAKLVAGYVESDLFYAYDMEAFGFEMQPYIAGRLSRTFDDTVDGVASAEEE